MPHYKDGTPAQVGDVVKGKGYNLRDKDKQLATIVGRVLQITPDASTCNIQVAVLMTDDLPPCFDQPFYRHYAALGLLHHATGPNGKKTFTRVELEYGQCDHFEKIG